MMETLKTVLAMLGLIIAGLIGVASIVLLAVTPYALIAFIAGLIYKAAMHFF